MSEDTASTVEGTTSNTVVGAGSAPVEQTPDQFYDPAAEQAKANEDVDPAHATVGMTTLGYTEASRIENTTAFQEAEREAAEAAQASPKSSKK